MKTKSLYKEAFCFRRIKLFVQVLMHLILKLEQMRLVSLVNQRLLIVSQLQVQTQVGKQVP